MEKNKIFRILGIEETKDKGKIKNAYREKLVMVNPEDDPEGFKELRTAYEEAIELSDIEDSEDENIPKTPIDKWVKKVEETYLNIESRQNTELWIQLFSDEVCTDFDTCDEAREKFLVFVMDHFRFPGSIWAVMEEKLQILSIKEELYEKFPGNFVDFLTYQLQNEGWMDYSLFEGNKNGDYDEFIKEYLDIKRFNDEKEYEEMDKALSNIKSYDIYHPYLDIEILRYMIYSKDYDNARNLEKNLRGRYAEDLYVLYYLSDALWEFGDYEGSYKDTEVILEKYKNHFAASKRKCDYLAYKNDYLAAKEGYLDLLDLDPGNESLISALEKTNDKLIEDYKAKINSSSSENNKEVQLELCWCLFQNRKLDECIEIMDSIEIDKDIYFDYHNLKGRTYLAMEKYNEALPHLQIWLEEILKIEDDGSPEVHKRIRRLGFAYYAIFSCYYHIGINNDIDKYTINLSIEYIDKAIEIEKDKSDIIEYKSQKALAFLKLDENEKCADLCDEIISIRNDYFPAYVYRQEAHYNLRKGQEVIDDYYNAIDIYPGYGKPYVFAAKVFFIYNQYEECINVIKNAREASIDSLELKLLEIKATRFKERSMENDKKAIESFKELFHEAEEDAKDMEDISIILHDMAVCYIDMNLNHEAFDTIERKLDIKYSEGSFKLKADVLYNMKEYYEAMKVYKELLEKHPDYDGVMFDIGDCYNALRKTDEAIEFYKKAISVNPEHPYANEKLAEIYKSAYEKNRDYQDYEKALEYTKKQVEIRPSCYYYNDLGLLYLKEYELEKAKEAFRLAMEDDPEDMYACNNMGYTFKVLGEYDEAYKYYQKAIEVCPEDDMLPYWNIATYYRIVENFEEAIKTYKYIFENIEDKENVLQQLGAVYLRMERYEDAIKAYSDALNEKDNDKIDNYLCMADTYSCMGNDKMALNYYKKAMKSNTSLNKAYRKTGDYYFYMSDNIKKALAYYKKAYDITLKKDKYNFDDATDEMLAMAYYGNNQKLAEKYYKEIMDYLDREHGSMEKWLSNKEFRKIRLFIAGMRYYYIRDFKMAEKYFNDMVCCYNCRSCRFGGCHEYYFGMGLISEIKGDYKAALDFYEKSCALCKDSFQYRYKVKKMKEKISEMRL